MISPSTVHSCLQAQFWSFARGTSGRDILAGVASDGKTPTMFRSWPGFFELELKDHVNVLHSRIACLEAAASPFVRLYRSFEIGMIDPIAVLSRGEVKGGSQLFQVKATGIARAWNCSSSVSTNSVMDNNAVYDRIMSWRSADAFTESPPLTPAYLLNMPTTLDR